MSDKKNNKIKGIPTEWSEIIISAGSNGRHITDFMIELGITWDDHEALLSNNKQYQKLISEYNKLCENYWYNMALNSMNVDGGHKFNSRLWSLIMRNKFSERWSESTKVDLTSKGEKISNNPIQIEIIKPNQE